MICVIMIATGINVGASPASKKPTAVISSSTIAWMAERNTKSENASCHERNREKNIVRVKSAHPEHEQGFFVINESDFDPSKHELWQEPVAKDEAKPAEPAKPAARETQMH